MTLKLVHDATADIIPIGNIRDIPAELRRLANDIESGEHGDVVNVLALVLYGPSGMNVCSLGGYPGPHELIGICEAAKFRILADDMMDDE